MKLLFISGQDSISNSMSYIVQEFIFRGYGCTILLTDYSLRNRIAFDKLGISYTYLHDNSRIDIKEFSTVFIGQSYIPSYILEAIYDSNTYLVSICFHTLSSKFVMSENYIRSNVLFCYGDLYKKVQKDAGYLIDCIPVNAPEYDRCYNMKNNTHSNKLLFIDAEHNPHVGKGKLSLAKSIIKAAKENPEYEILLRPRNIFSKLSEDMKKNHLFYHIELASNGLIPKNIILIDEMVDLVEQISSVDIVCSLVTSALYPAIIMKKPIIILIDIDNSMPSVYDYKNNYFLFEHFGKYGKNIIAHYDLYNKIRNAEILPNEISEYMFFNSNGKSSKLIADYVEYVNRNVPLDYYLTYLNIDTSNYKNKIENYLKSVNANESKVLKSDILFKLPIYDAMIQVETVVFTYGKTFEIVNNNFTKKMKSFLNSMPIDSTKEYILDYIKKEKNKSFMKVLTIAYSNGNKETISSVTNYVFSYMYKDGMIEELKSFPIEMRTNEINRWIAKYYENKNINIAIDYHKNFINEYKFKKLLRTGDYYDSYKKVVLYSFRKFDLFNLIKIFDFRATLFILSSKARIKFGKF